MKLFLLICVTALVVWILWGYIVSNVPSLTYSVVEKRKGYEIRQYDSYIAATAVVPFTGREGLNAGFRVLAGYIFGGNVSNKSIAMTAPVQVTEDAIQASEKIAMTTPVMTQTVGTTTSVTFSMPSEYTLETLPKPNDTSIKIQTIPSKKFAAYTFTWYFSEERIQTKKDYFVAKLQKEGVTIIGAPIFAGYSGPGTAPFMMRNEILIEIQ
ncbi:MAG: hypothetical protein RI996_34 [Candidatus Parcubacteria bacterium]|jgi:hypothetical protein